MVPVHVKGKKEDITASEDLTYPEQLNIESDRNAKAWLASNEGLEKSPQPTASVLDSEHWAVLQGSIKLTSNKKDTVLQAYHGAACGYDKNQLITYAPYVTLSLKLKTTFLFSKCGKPSTPNQHLVSMLGDNTHHRENLPPSFRCL